MPTNFGASGPTIDSPDILQYITGQNSITRSMSFVTEYKGKGNKTVDKYLDAGHSIFFNLNYERVNKSGSGDKLPNPFPKDLTRYKNQLEPIFQYYSNHKYKDNIIMVCENEPTTKGFHSGPMSDYLAMLQAFVELGYGKYGFKCVDGAVHVDRVLASAQPKQQGDEVDENYVAEQYIEDEEKSIIDLLDGYQVYEQISDTEFVHGHVNVKKPSGQVAELLNGYAKIPDLYAVNLHTANIGGDFDSAKIKKCTDKVMSWTGHKCVSNEWHVEKTNNPELLTKIAKGWHDAGIEHTVYLSGAGGDDIDLNNGMNLTPFGTAYRNFIIVAQGAGS